VFRNHRRCPKRFDGFRNTRISLVISAYNEAEPLPDLLANIHAAVKTHSYDTEVTFINNGSTDATAEVLDTKAAQSQLPVHVIHFRRNRGKAAALTAGFQYATGDIILTLDADLQDEPIEISKLIDTLETENHDTVSGWKYPRKELCIDRMAPSAGFVKRLPSDTLAVAFPHKPSPAVFSRRYSSGACNAASCISEASEE